MKTFRVLLGLFGFMLAMSVVPLSLADAPIEGRNGRTELRFMEGMIDHHQMAIDMANDCLAREVSAALRTECQMIIDSQQPEIDQLQAWLLAWYNVEYTPMPMADLMSQMDDGMAGMEGMEGMPAVDPAMTMGMFAGFNRLEGDEYEAAWLEAMIDHHDDAIHMSERFLERDADSVAHPDLRALAQTIIDAQTGEIAHFEEMLTAMSGS